MSENKVLCLPVIEEHYRANYKRLIKSCTFRCDTVWAAEDCVQEAYERCMRYWKTYNQSIEFGRWFSMILNNCVSDYRKGEKQHFADEFVEDYHDGVNCDKHIHRIYWGINQLIDKKPEPAKEILTYHFEYEYSATDISKCTPHTYANISKVISRFKEELREIYGS